VCVQGGLAKLERMPAPADPLQLQEYYTAQSDLLENIMRTRRQNANAVHSQGVVDITGVPSDAGGGLGGLRGTVAVSNPTWRPNRFLMEEGGGTTWSVHPCLGAAITFWCPQGTPWRWGIIYILYI